MRRGVKKLTDTANNTVECLVINDRGDSGWGQCAVEAEEVCGETGDVRSGHGSSADGLSLPVIPGGSDVHAGGPDTNAGTIIGVAGLRVVDIGIGNGDRVLRAGRRDVDRVPVFVSGGCDDGDTTVVKLKIITPQWCFRNVPSAQRTLLIALSIEGAGS